MLGRLSRGTHLRALARARVSTPASTRTQPHTHAHAQCLHSSPYRFPAMPLTAATVLPAQHSAHGFLFKDQRRFLNQGFFPKRKNFEDIVNMEKFKEASTSKIVDVWKDYHTAMQTACAAMPGHMYDLFASRAKECPMFVLPLMNAQGGLRTVLVQHQDNVALFTFLEEYQRLAHLAPPVLACTHYTEMKDKKDIVLLGGDFDTKRMSLDEANILATYMHLYYLNDSKYRDFVMNFNHRPRDFMWDALMGDLKKLNRKQADVDAEDQFRRENKREDKKEKATTPKNEDVRSMPWKPAEKKVYHD